MAKNKNRFKYQQDRTVNTHAYLYKCAYHSLEEAKEKEEGSFYRIMTSLTFSAFALEAFSNHVGEETLDYWDSIERISPIEKQKVLHSRLKLKFDLSKRPLQTANNVFKFRNLMAHGKTESISGEFLFKEQPDLKPGEELVKTKWEEFVNIESAERALADISEIIEYLNDAAGLQKYPLHTLGSGSGVTTTI